MKGSPTTPQRSLKVSDTANSLLQNRINISIIFNYLRDHGVSYRAQIARELGISAPAVARAIERLLNDEYVIESERILVENGRKAAQVSVNAGRGYIIGLDLLADPIKIAISDFGGTLHNTFLATPIGAGDDFSSHLISAIETGWLAFRGKISTPDPRILAIGIGVPAVVEPRTGEILNANLYEHMLKTNIYGRVTEHFGIPVFIENTANLAAIGEWKRGVGRHARNLVFIEFGNGIGAGIIFDGDLYRGAQGGAGEIGYFITSPEDLGYSTSRLGLLETKASLRVLKLGERYADAKTLFEGARSGDGEAIRVIGGAMKHLTVAIVNIMLLLNPELVVIGGAACELPGADELILHPLIDEVHRNYPFAPVSIQLASLGANASLIGAVQFALDSLVVHAYPYRL